MGKVRMSKRILIAYASKSGSTKEIAEFIGEELKLNEYIVDVVSVYDIKKLGHYDAVIVGSAVGGGNWLPAGRFFVEKFAKELDQKPLAIFTVCRLLKEDNEENRIEAKKYSARIRQMVKPLIEGFFAGRVDSNKYSFTESMRIRMANIPQGDWRKWDLIKEWSHEVFSAFDTYFNAGDGNDEQGK
jgi:menaquinone-dependent protoporphyrinogen oxidase